MKRFSALLLAIPLLLLTACGDDDETPTNGGNGPPPPRVEVVDKNAPPSLANVNDTIWDSVDPVTVTLSKSGPRKTMGGKAAEVASQVDVQAINYNQKLFLRFVWADDSLHILKNFWFLSDPDNFNFTQRNDEGEDQLLAMFAGMPNDEFDVWFWRALTTDRANLAEGYYTEDGDLLRDEGNQEVAYDNSTSLDPNRPKYAHEDGLDYPGHVLYIDDTVDASNFTLAGWPVNTVVPGWYIDSAVGTRVQDPAYAQSRWEIEASSFYDSELQQYTLILARDYTTGTVDDMDFSIVDSVQMKIVIVDNLVEPQLTNGSQQSSSELFWFIP